MEQVARGLLDPVDGFLRSATHVIHDRDPLYTAGWKSLLASRACKRGDTCEEPELQRRGGAVYPDREGRMSGPLHRLGRTAPATPAPRIHCSLSWRAVPPGTGQSDHPAGRWSRE